MLSRGLLRLLAVACGVTIANVYYAQPLLHTIAAGMGVGESAAGVVVTATQLGFATGLVFVVPLGDIVARRPLIGTLLALDAVLLAATAVAPNLGTVAAFAVLVGLCSVVVQMIIPFAATLARPERRAGVLGVLMGSVLLGVLLSRTFAGVLAGVAGWRGVFGAAAGLMAVTALVVGRALPDAGREVGIGYLAQLRAVVRLARHEPVLRIRAVIGAAQFGAFSCFWTTVTLLLAGPRYAFSQADIGLFALVGAAGAGCVLAGGRLLDRYRRHRFAITGVSIGMLLLSFGVLALGGRGLAWLIAGALLMDAFSQGVHVTNQAVIYELVDGARARVTTVYMTTYFVGGALGTAAGVAVYARYGWPGACATAACFCCVGGLAWWAGRRHEHPAAVRRRSVPT